MWAAKHCSMLFSSGQNRLCVFCCVDGEKPVLIQIKCKDDNIESIDHLDSHLSRDYSNNNMDNKDVYLTYYIERETKK